MRVFSHTRNHQAGSVAIVAAFIIVVVGFLGSAMVSELLVSNRSQAAAVQATQAYYIADAGVEWAANKGAGSGAPVSFGNGTFTVTSDAGAWVALASVGNARRQVRCEAVTAVPSGLDYVIDSRTIAGRNDEEFKFRVVNNQLASVTINKMKVSWDAPIAFFEQIKINVLTVHDYTEVWKYEANGNVRWANGELKAFNQDPSVAVGQYKTMEIMVKDYKTLQTGPAPRVYFTNTIMTLQFSNNDTLVGEVVVDLPLDE